MLLTIARRVQKNVQLAPSEIMLGGSNPGRASSSKCSAVRSRRRIARHAAL